MTTIELRGCYTALVTPMKDAGDVDYEAWKRLIQLQLEAGVTGLVPVATTGESPALTTGEREKLVEIAVKMAKEGPAKAAVIPGVGTNSTRQTVENAHRAKELGADAILVVTPYYNKPNDTGLTAHFEAVAEVGIPMILYNVPGRTGRNMPAPIIERLAKIPGVIGVKEASGDVSQAAEIIYRCGTNDSAESANGGPFAVLSGDDGLTLPIIALGGVGLVSVVSNLVPERSVALTNACLAGRFDEARRLHEELLPLTRAAFVESNPIPIKRAMTLAGLPAGPTRLPLGPLSAEAEQLIRQELTRLRI